MAVDAVDGGNWQRRTVAVGNGRQWRMVAARGMVDGGGWRQRMLDEVNVKRNN